MSDTIDASSLPPQTPRDIRLGLTKAEDVAFPLRWGILGAGEISRQWVLASSACEGATFAAVAARSRDRAKEFASQHGIETAYGSYAEMLASPDVDIVYIGTINSLHKDHSLMAIEAGKHVLCEKPLAVTVEQGRAIVDAARDAGVRVPVNFVLRYNRVTDLVKAVIESGVLGQVLSARLTNCASGKRYVSCIDFQPTPDLGGTE